MPGWHWIARWRSTGCIRPSWRKGAAGRWCAQADGILVPGGFGSRGTEGKMQAIRYARENKVPYLGLCLGMQLMVVEFARFILNNEEPNSTEFDRGTPYPVIDLMPDQRGIADMGGTMRLGLYPCALAAGTRSPPKPMENRWCRNATAIALS